MKKKLKYTICIIIIIIILLLVQCVRSSSIRSLGLLPSKVDELKNGGHASTNYLENIEKSNIPIDLLYSTWSMECAVDVSVEENFELPANEKFQLSYKEGDKELTDTVCAFPLEFSLVPNTKENLVCNTAFNIFVDDLFSMSDLPIVSFTSDNVLKDDGISNGAINEENTDNDEKVIYPFGMIADNLKTTQGSARYINADCKKDDALWNYISHQYYTINILSGDILAIGLTNIPQNDPIMEETTLEKFSNGIGDINEYSVVEIDYHVSFEGSKLVLTYGDESVTYVSTAYRSEHKPYYVDAGLVKGTNAIDDIQCITISDKETKMILNDNIKEGSVSSDEDEGSYYHKMTSGIVKNMYDGYIDASFVFNNDKSQVTIKLNDGSEHQYECILSDYAIGIKEGDNIAAYSILNSIEPSPNWDPNSAMGSYFSTVSIDSTGTTTYVGELGSSNDASYIAVGLNELYLYSDMQLEEFVEIGFNTDVDLNQYMKSGIVSDQIVFTMKSEDTADTYEVKLKAVNPFENEIPLGKCVICSIFVDDSTGMIRKGDGSLVGTTTKNTLEYYYKPAYVNNDDQLVYKINIRSRLLSDHGADAYIFHGFKHSDDTGDVVLDWSKNSSELTYYFDDKGILESFEISNPTLLYNGLQDNIDRSELKDMSAAKMTATASVRNSILERLSKEFEKNDITVDIDDLTGKITLKNSILFDYDSSDIKKGGKEYIKKFIKVYTSVILDDEFKDAIKGIEFEGHTDSRGSYSYNQVLSENRASSVLDYIIGNESGINDEQKKIFKELSVAKGYAFKDLVYDKGEEDREASRRVEIKFYINIEE